MQNWFEQQVQKAKKFQPLAALNQKLRGLEAFEANNTSSPVIGAAGRPSSRQSSPAPEIRPIDPDEVVTRAHWQRPDGYGHDQCAEPVCGRRLGGTNGIVNCRHCGRLFCDEHTMYQMRLSRSAQHEPIRGFWCRVCETCYKSRAGYNDHNGLERNISNAFLSKRKLNVDKATMEISRLEKRLTKLTQLIANPPPVDQEQGAASSFLSSLTGNKQHMRALEQSVVAWEDDASVSQCPYCHQPFTSYSFRRHHCRVCGRVVCADADTACSAEVALNADAGKSFVIGDPLSADFLSAPNTNIEKATSQIPIDIRMCKTCQHTLFAKADFAREVAHKPPDQKAFENLLQFEAGIKLLLPRFQRLLHDLQSPHKLPTSVQLAEAAKFRKRLTEAFTRYDAAGRRIRDLPTDSPTQQKLNKASYAQSANFLHANMLPLKALPKILRRANISSANRDSSPASSLRPGSALAAFRIDSDTSSRRDSSASTSTTNTIALAALEVEEKELRERLIVLEEQQFMVQEMVGAAKKKRQFDEVAALNGNVQDLDKEIEMVKKQLQGLDWQSAYMPDTPLI